MCRSKGAAGIFLLTKDGKVPTVLDKEKPVPHLWKFPGGTIEHGESNEACARRELYEETGFAIDIRDPDKFPLTLISTYSGEGYTYSLFGYYDKRESPEINLVPGLDGEEVRFSDITTLCGREFLHRHYTLAEEAIQMVQYNGVEGFVEFLYKKDSNRVH